MWGQVTPRLVLARERSLLQEGPPALVVPGTHSRVCVSSPFPCPVLVLCPRYLALPRQAGQRGLCPQLLGPPSWPTPRGTCSRSHMLGRAPGRSRKTVRTDVLASPLVAHAATAQGSRAHVASPVAAVRGRPFLFFRHTAVPCPPLALDCPIQIPFMAGPRLPRHSESSVSRTRVDERICAFL